MRDLTTREKWFVSRGRCPFCGSKKWYQGPSGGLCTNIYCQQCKAGFNVAPGDFSELISEPDAELMLSLKPPSNVVPMAWWPKLKRLWPLFAIALAAWVYLIYAGSR